MARSAWMCACLSFCILCGNDTMSLAIVMSIVKLISKGPGGCLLSIKLYGGVFGLRWIWVL